MAIQWLANTLHLTYTKNDKDDSDYLKLIALIENKWGLLQDLVNLLKPFFDATQLLSGSKYTTLNFIYLTIYFLMEKFSISDKSDDELFDLIYNSEAENIQDAGVNTNNTQDINLLISDDEDNETNSDDELVQNSIVESRLSRTSLRGARERGQRRERGSGNETIEKLQRLYSNKKFENELNTTTTTTGRFGLEFNICQTNITSFSSNSIFNVLFDNENDNNNIIQDIDEVDDYLNLCSQKQSCDPLVWWNDHSKRFSLLSKIAHKYLFISAISVLSERLFSDAALFPIFPPSD
ncbi:unnamed protein product [Rhizophagus irregularis]|nr:unnamed protein product [Rhizophagus irregularis]